MSDWDTYYQKHLKRPVWEILKRAVNKCKNLGVALDLGAGTLVESKYLLDSGFKKVVAVDNSPQVSEFAKNLDSERLEVLVSSFQDLKFVPDTFDLITAQYALPFYGPEGFDEFIKKVIASLKTEGIFVGQLFGNRDSWNTLGKNMAFQTKEEVENLLKDLNIVEFIEEEKDGPSVSGEKKHWHVFHFIAVK